VLYTHSKAFALTWYRALTWYCSPARPFGAPDVPLHVTEQQGSASPACRQSPSPACRQLSRARDACAGSASAESTKLKHGTKLGRWLHTGGRRRALLYMRTGKARAVAYFLLSLASRTARLPRKRDDDDKFTPGVLGYPHSSPSHTTAAGPQRLTQARNTPLQKRGWGVGPMDGPVGLTR